MKKIQILIVLGAVAAMTTMAEETLPMSDAELGKILWGQFGVTSYELEWTFRIAREREIPSEQMARVLERIVRKGLVAQEEEKRGELKPFAIIYVN
ncbi:MAG: hypothetical protein FWF84_07650, partial [Kiritimatiellaeota bacterium]|nr:hypothetical protein [Kiritimatiellota bacterium]